MKMKGIKLQMEFLVKIVVFALFVLVLSFVVFGDELRMNMEAQKTQERLAEAFIDVAGAYRQGEVYDYYHRYGGKRGGAEFLCEIPLDSACPCKDENGRCSQGIAVVLPQELHKLSTDVIPAMGDPKYVIYWDSYDFVESSPWSSWFWFDAILWFAGGPISKGVGKGFQVAFKVGTKAARFLTFGGMAARLGGGALKTAFTELGTSLVKLSKLFIGKSGKISKVYEKIAEVGGKAVEEKFVELGEKQLGKDSLEIVAKGVVEEITREGEKKLVEKSSLPEVENVIQQLDEIAKTSPDGKLAEEAKNAKEAYETLKSQLEEAGKIAESFGLEGKVSARIAVKKQALQALKELEEKGALSEEVAKKLRALVKREELSLCAPAGVTASYLLSSAVKDGLLSVDEEGNVYYKDQKLARDYAELALLHQVGNMIKTRALSKDATGKIVLTEVDLLDVAAKNPEDWVLYEITYENGKVSSKPLGKIKELEADSRLRGKSVKNCFSTAAFAVGTGFLTHYFEAKYETVKGEKATCEKALCLKGKTISPKAVKKRELQKAFEEARIAGIKLAVVNEKGEIESPAGWEANFYLASPCFAYAQIWVAKCKDPKTTYESYEQCPICKPASGEEPADDCCCIWVALKQGFGMPFQEKSEFNYCAWSAKARTGEAVQTLPWPWVGYWT